MCKYVGLLMLVLCVGLVQGAFLKDMGDSGQFSRDSLAISTAPGSYWSYHVSWANATVTMVNDGGTAPSNFLDLYVGYYPRTAHVWYIDATTSGAADHWGVSADLAGVLGRDNGNRAMRLGTSTSPGTFSSWAFSMNLIYNTSTINWVAGSLSGSTSISGMTTAWTNAVITYDAATGAAVGTFGGVPVFNVTTESGLTVNALSFLREAPSGIYDNGSLLVDNVSAYMIPEPASVSLLVLAAGAVLRRRVR